MTFLKNLTVSLLSFLLFLSLTVFGLAFAVKSTALNPGFIVNEINRLPISSLVEENIQIQPTPEIPNLNDVVHKTITDIEPQIKAQAGSAVYSVYDYLLGEKLNPDLALTIRRTFLSTDFVTSLVDSVDISSLAGDYISRQFGQAIPVHIPNLDVYVKNALVAAEPDFKAQIVAVSGPVADYLLGINPTLNAIISLDKVEQSLKTNLLQVFLDSPPPELAGVPRDLRQAYFNQFYQDFAAQIPATYRLDESLIDAGTRSDVTRGISNAEDGLRQARHYVALFQQYYILLIVLMGLLTLGIVLLVRNVKDVLHRLGVPLVTYGAIEYAGIWVTKYFISTGKLHFPVTPPELETWLLQLISDTLKPLEVFSLAILIGGAVLVVASFLYKPNKDLNWD